MTAPLAVWLTDEGYACRVFMEDVREARLAIAQLTRAFVFQTSDPVRYEQICGGCSFRLAYGPELNLDRVATIFTRMPGFTVGIASPMERLTNLRRQR